MVCISECSPEVKEGAACALVLLVAVEYGHVATSQGLTAIGQRPAFVPLEATLRYERARNTIFYAPDTNSIPIYGSRVRSKILQDLYGDTQYSLALVVVKSLSLPGQLGPPLSARGYLE
jgi:hypothetical protein